VSRSLVFYNRQRLKKVDGGLLKRATKFLLAGLLKERDFVIGVTLVDETEMTRLNESFLRHKGSTDVITFDYSETKRKPRSIAGTLEQRSRISQPSPAPLHGDVIVCVDEAQVQARRFHTSWQSEVMRYIVHGVLHLSGYDDQSTRERRLMKLEENRLLAELLSRFPIEKRLSKPARPVKVPK